MQTVLRSLCASGGAVARLPPPVPELEGWCRSLIAHDGPVLKEQDRISFDRACIAMDTSVRLLRAVVTIGD